MGGLIIVGDFSFDYYYFLQGDYPSLGAKALVVPAERQIGGMGMNAACSAAGVNDHVFLYSQIQENNADSQLLLAELKSYRVDSSLISTGSQPNPYTIIFCHNSGERSIFVAAYQPRALEPDLISSLASHRYPVYATAYSLRHRLTPALAACLGEQQRPLFIDFDAELQDGDLDMLRLASIISCNQFAEKKLWQILGGRPKRYFWQQQQRLQGIIITRGENGGSFYNAAGVCHFAAAKVAVRDSTGAGDCFNAVFYALWLEHGIVDQALDWTSAAAAIVIQTRGPKILLDHTKIAAQLRRQQPLLHWQKVAPILS